MAGVTTRSTQASKVRKASMVTSRSPTPQPGTLQPPPTEGQDNITYGIDDAASACEYLQKNTMLIENSPVTTEALRYAILHTAGIPQVTAPLRSALHAIAILLKQVEKQTTDEYMIAAVTKKMQENLRFPIQQLNTAAISLEADMQVLHAQLEVLDSSAIKQAITNMESMAAKVETSTNTLANTTSSYRDALLCTAKSGSLDSPLIDPQITQCILIQAKQVLVVFDEMLEAQDSLTSLKELTETRIQMLIDKAGASAPKTKIEIEEVTRICNGGILFQLNSKEAADWIRSPGIKEEFAWAFDAAAEIRERNHAIFAPFIPLTFKTDDPHHLQEIGDRNRLNGGKVLEAQWIKPPTRRPDSQLYAHCILMLSSVEATNLAICDGIYIHGKKIYPSKLKKDPLHCLKCHKWGHRALHCQAELDTCSTCGGTHRTANCEENEKRWCVSCQAPTHASWDWQCPAFLAHCSEYDRRNPDNLLRYYPTVESWMHYIAPPPLTKEQRYPTRWATTSKATTHNPKPPNQRSSQRGGARPTTMRQRQRTLEEYLVHPAVPPPRAARSHHPLPHHPLEHSNGFSNPLPEHAHQTDTSNFNWAEEVEFANFNYD